MASPEEIAQWLPETLPEDFSDWDGEASPTAMPGNSSGLEAAHSFGETPKPLGQSADHDAILASLMDRPRVWRSTSPAPVFVKQQNEYVHWEREAAPAPLPSNSSGLAAAHSFSETARPLGQSSEREAILSPVADRPRVSRSASSIPVSLKQQESASGLVDESPSRASRRLEASHTTHEIPMVPSQPNAGPLDGMLNSPELTATVQSEADKALFQLFSPMKVEVLGERKKPGKKRTIVAAVSACSILLPLILMIPLFHHGTNPVAKQSVQPLPGATDTQLKTNTPPASGPLTQDKPPATTARQRTTDNQTTNEEEGVNSARVQTEMMNDQLTAPTRIPKQVVENAPPPASFGTAGADGLGGSGANDSVFHGHAQPIVKPAFSKPLAISSGVAAGMLIRKTAPIYPLIARAARVSGTVELQATISKNGTIKDLHVVNGPEMLRQAAIDAVQTWRYKPYKLNNQPTEVETTINVVFSLGG